MQNKLGILPLIAVSFCLLAAEPVTNVAGTWTGEVKGQDGGIGHVKFVLRRKGNHISGTAGPADKEYPGHIYDAKLEGNHLVFAVNDKDDSGLSLTYQIDLTVTNNRMVGKAHGRSQERSWTLDVSVTRGD
jgi:hypothetical protein